MSDRHDNNDNRRDMELDKLLAPLREAGPGDLATERWQKAVQVTRQASSVKRRWLKRGLEWAVAASIGFGVATALMQARVIMSADQPRHIEMHMFTGPVSAATDKGNENYYDMDATDVHLVAKSR
jgi:hypothetical protein